MIKLKALRKYEDLELGRWITVGEEIEVSEERGRYLLQKQAEYPGMFQFQVLRIDKLNKDKNAKTKSKKRG